MPGNRSAYQQKRIDNCYPVNFILRVVLQPSLIVKKQVRANIEITCAAAVGGRAGGAHWYVKGKRGGVQSLSILFFLILNSLISFFLTFAGRQMPKQAALFRLAGVIAKRCINSR